MMVTKSFDYLEHFNNVVNHIEVSILERGYITDNDKHQLQRMMKQCFDAGVRFQKNQKVVDKEKQLQALKGAYKTNNPVVEEGKDIYASKLF